MNGCWERAFETLLSDEAYAKYGKAAHSSLMWVSAKSA